MSTVRVGVFFDGTGNNMFGDGGQPTDNSLTNVAALYQGYASGGSGDTTYSKLYVSGPGTTFGTTSSDHGNSGVTDPAIIAKDSVSLANAIDAATGATSGMRIEAGKGAARPHGFFGCAHLL
ncbi:MAG: hypothetical protein H7Z12_07310 [Rhodospirillaceae bacterium]|nr:hypothetical protein [Rhodospirillales bacterium]